MENRNNKLKNNKIMKKLSLLIVAIFISLSSFSQKVDVKYFDRNGNVTNPEYAKYKELTSTKDNGIIETTYYKRLCFRIM